MLQIAYTVDVTAVFQVIVHPVAGVEADPPTGADTRTSVLLPVTVGVENPPPTALGWPAGHGTVAVPVAVVAVTTTVEREPEAGGPVGPCGPVAPVAPAPGGPVGPCVPVGP